MHGVLYRRFYVAAGAAVLLQFAGCGAEPEGNDTTEPTQAAQLAQTACPTFNAAKPDPSFCTAACPCAAGQGDCDSNADCATGNTCVADVGSIYGLPAQYDVCEPTGTENCPQFNSNINYDNASFCTTTCPCAPGEGDCDSDAECESGSVCYYDVGASYGLKAHYDVCDVAGAGPCPTFDPAKPDGSFCTTACPCAHGEGDCDTDADCEAGNKCIQDVGQSYGLPANYDVCVFTCPTFDPTNLDSQFCTAACPCGHGEGDCDSNAECKPGTTCRDNVGATYGMPASWDVCVSTT